MPEPVSLSHENGFLVQRRGFRPCVYRKLKSDYNGDEVRQGWRVNE